MTKVRRLMTADGTGSGTVVGTIETEQSWDDSSRLTGRTDDAGNTTGYVYDPLDRVERLIYADGAEEP